MGATVKRGALSLDGPFWRSLARRVATHGPEWFVRLAPPVIGVAICAFAAKPREAIVANLRLVRGDMGRLRDAADVARTFATYASCLTEVFAADRGPLEAMIWGETHLEDALARGRGVVLATAHTAGWEAAGPLLSRDRGLSVMIVELAERDAATRAIQDGARRAAGVLVAHVGDDPLSALPLTRHLRQGGVVALQMDRAPRGMRARDVTMFGHTARLPEGLLRLAAMTGAPVVPVFAARTGHRRYEIVLRPPIELGRSSGEGEVNFAAQRLADELSAFVRVRPTQWFHFEGR